MADIHLGDQLFSELSHSEQDCVLIAANVLIQWLLQEVKTRKETQREIEPSIAMPLISSSFIKDIKV